MNLADRAAAAAPDHRPAADRRRHARRHDGGGARRAPRAAGPGQLRRSPGSATARPAVTPSHRAGPAAGDRLDLQTVHPRRAEPPGAGRASGAGATSSRSTAARSPAARCRPGRRARRSRCTRSPSLMISISDNSATDMLLHTLGRENVERMMATIGVARSGAQPAVAVDAGAGAAQDRARRRRSTSGGRPTRRRAASCSPTTMPRADAAADRHRPLRRQSARGSTVEWFASAADLVRTMDWLRRNGDETARAILAINPGLPPRARGDFAYVGYQGRLRARRAQPHLAGPHPGAAPGTRSPAAGTIRPRRSTRARFAALAARARSQLLR